MTDLLETQTDQPQQQEQVTQSTDLLSDEQKPDEKEVMQKRINDSQAFIDQLKQERQQDRELIQQMEDKLKKLESALPTLDDAVKRTSQKPVSEDKTDVLDVDSVSKAVLEKIKAQQQEELTKQEQQKADELARNTYEATNQAIISQYGDKAREVLNDKLQELGISNEKAKFMASDPELSKTFLHLVGAKPAQSSNIPNSGINTKSLSQTKTGQLDLRGKTSVELAQIMKEMRQNQKGN